MAIISAPYPVIEGNISPGYEFSLQFFMPNSEFYELYPDNTARRIFLNVDKDEKENIQAYLEEYTDRNNILMISEKSVEMEYRKETSASMAISNILAGMILLIGVVNMVNVEITSVKMRKKEFAMMQSLGMTKKQLRYAQRGLFIRTDRECVCPQKAGKRNSISKAFYLPLQFTSNW